MFGIETPVFRVDMNSMRDGLHVTTLLKHVTSFPMVPRVELGDYVKITDDEGNVWNALVDSVDNRRLRLKVDWSTWTPPSLDLNGQVVLSPGQVFGAELTGLAE